MTHITVKIPDHVKQDLDFLSKIVGKNMSELIRDIVVPLSKIRSSVEAIETVSKAEEAVVRAIVRMHEFQGLLEKLFYMQKTIELKYGWETSLEYINANVLAEISYEDIEEFREMTNKDEDEEEPVYTAIRKENDRYTPVLIYDCSDWNSQHTIKFYSFVDKQVRTLAELTLWLKATERELQEELHRRLKEIRESLKKLIQ